MEEYELEVDPRARRQLRKLPDKERRRAAMAVGSLAQQPRPPGARKLRAGDGWRVRVGPFRIFYLVDDGARLVRITEIGHRRDVYRRR